MPDILRSLRAKPKSLIARIASEENLYNAWRKVRANQGGAGVDAVTLSQFEARLEEHLTDLSRRLREEEYLPTPLRRASIPKSDGGTRGLAIPTVGDRVAQRACVNILEPVFEAEFLDCSYGYRPGRGVSDAAQAVQAARQQGFGWVVDADIAAFFDTLNHAILLEQLRSRLADRAVLRLIQLWVEAGSLAPPRPAAPAALSTTGRYLRGVGQDVLNHWLGRDWNSEAEAEDGGEPRAPGRRLGRDAVLLACALRHTLVPPALRTALWVGSGVGAAALGAVTFAQVQRARRGVGAACGTAQGSPLSPLLANVYLHAFDTVLTRQGLHLVRYADDFVLCCASEARARQARQSAQEALAALHLTLHAGKTRLVAADESFVFLGHVFDSAGFFVPVPPTRSETTRAALTHAGRKVRERGKTTVRQMEARWQSRREHKDESSAGGNR